MIEAIPFIALWIGLVAVTCVGIKNRNGMVEMVECCEEMAENQLDLMKKMVLLTVMVKTNKADLDAMEEVGDE